MPDIAWNVAAWDVGHDWSAAGEEWSKPWGGSEAQWFGTLYPRLHRFLPTGGILEIAPGFGRWTKFLIPNSSRYVGVDLSQKCVDACRQIFHPIKHASFIKNDGFRLSDVGDGSWDFVFSFDSLVHADLEIIETYIREIVRALSADGIAHSPLELGSARRGCSTSRTQHNGISRSCRKSYRQCWWFRPYSGTHRLGRRTFAGLPDAVQQEQRRHFEINPDRE